MKLKSALKLAAGGLFLLAGSMIPLAGNTDVITGTQNFLSSSYTVSLASEPFLIPVSLPSNAVNYAFETGALQNVGNWFGLSDASLIQVFSDTEASAVPLPGALPLFGTGVVLLGFLRRRRSRPVAEAMARLRREG